MSRRAHGLGGDGQVFENLSVLPYEKAMSCTITSPAHGPDAVWSSGSRGACARYKPTSAGRVKASVIVASRSLRGDFNIGHDTRLLSGNGTALVRRNRDNYTRKDGTVKNQPRLHLRADIHAGSDATANENSRGQSLRGARFAVARYEAKQSRTCDRDCFGAAAPRNDSRAAVFRAVTHAAARRHGR